MQKTDTPGPGNYRLPSEFGYYESATFQRDRSRESNEGVKTDPN